MQTDFMDKAPTAAQIADEVSRLKSVVTDAVDDGIRSAMKAIDQGREMAEDAIDDARRVSRRNPQAMGLVFAAGLVLGGFVIWACSSRR